MSGIGFEPFLAYTEAIYQFKIYPSNLKLPSAVFLFFTPVPPRTSVCDEEQNQRPGDITSRGLETPLVPVPCPAKQGAHVFLEHGERRIGQPGLKERRLDK